MKKLQKCFEIWQKILDWAKEARNKWWGKTIQLHIRDIQCSQCMSSILQGYIYWLSRMFTNEEHKREDFTGETLIQEKCTGYWNQPEGIKMNVLQANLES